MFRRVTTGEKHVWLSFLGGVGVCGSVLQKSVDVSLAYREASRVYTAVAVCCR